MATYGIHRFTSVNNLQLQKKKEHEKFVVLDLVQDLGQEYGINCDNFFTSLELATELAKQQKNALGTLRQKQKGGIKRNAALQIQTDVLKYVSISR